MSGFIVDLHADEAGQRRAERLDHGGIAWTTLAEIRSVTFRDADDPTPVPPARVA